MALLFHTFSIPEHWYVFDANTNSVFSVTEDEHRALTEIERGGTALDSTEVLRKFQDKGFCLEANIETIRHPDSDIIAAYLNRKIEQVTLQITQQCNLRCDYCTFSGRYKGRVHSTKTMSFEIAKLAIDMALSHSEDSKSLTFGFYGGEPLLELPLIKDIVSYIKQRAENRGIRFTITTNGTLLTPKIYDYLIGNDFSVVVSLDGPKEAHDKSRKYPNGRGSYDVIMKNIEEINRLYPNSREKLRFNAVLSPDIDDDCLPSVFRSDDVIPYYDNRTMSLVNNTYTDEPRKYSDTFATSYNHELCKLLLSMLGKINRKHVSVLLMPQESRYEQEYSRLRKIEKLPPVLHPSGPCIAGSMRLFVNADGKFYPCERVSEISELTVIGDLINGFDYKKACTVMNPGQVTADECKKCWAVTHCVLCVAHSDDLKGLSRHIRMSSCKNVCTRYENTLKTICFLKEAGYTFKK